jgi:hypothetical protein
VHDTFLVRGSQRVCDRNHEIQHLWYRKPAGGNQAIQSSPFHDFHRQEADAADFLDGVERDDVRVIECCDGLGLTLQAGEAVAIRGEGGGKGLDWLRRDRAACPVRGRPRPCRRCRAARRFHRTRDERRRQGPWEDPQMNCRD